MKALKFLLIVFILLAATASLSAATPENTSQVTPSDDFYCTTSATTTCGATTDNSQLRLQGTGGTLAYVGIIRFPVNTPWAIAKPPQFGLWLQHPLPGATGRGSGLRYVKQRCKSAFPR